MSISSQLYATAPDTLPDPKDCWFYHRTELPGLGEVGEHWDLRHCIESYLGNVDFSGRRVLDIGAASGYLTFHMDAAGANVVSFDMASGRQWDVVPKPGETNEEKEEFLEDLVLRQKKLKNGYWLSRHLLGAKSQVHYGNVYDISPDLGQFDTVVFGMILGHLQNPFQAIISGSRLCKDQLIVTNQVMDTQDRPIARLMPTVENMHRQVWWALSRAAIREMLNLCGFSVKDEIESHPINLSDPQNPARIRCISFVAYRR